MWLHSLQKWYYLKNGARYRRCYNRPLTGISYLTATTAITLRVFEGHSLIASLFKLNFLYIIASVNKILTKKRLTVNLP